MDILKCTHAVSVTILLATAPVVPAAAQSANAVLQDTSRQDFGTVFFCRPRPEFCASSRSRECLRVSMPSTFMPWASASRLVRLGGLALQSGQHAPRYHAGPGHAGDMPNLHIPPNGSLEVELVDTAITIDRAKPNSVFQPDGTAVVIHNGKDDYVTDPARNAGNRIARDQSRSDNGWSDASAIARAETV
jgi:superoxide dismutase, Cu-Zn family